MITLLLETGVVLIAIPWSVYWERNLFLDLVPAFRQPLQHQFTRGAGSGRAAADLTASSEQFAAQRFSRTS